MLGCPDLNVGSKFIRCLKGVVRKLGTAVIKRRNLKVKCMLQVKKCERFETGTTYYYYVANHVRELYFIGIMKE